MTTDEFNVRALYDFAAESEHELSFRAHDILTITSQSGGAGWWHAKNSAGQFGAIPENYVQRIDDTSDVPLSPTPNTNSNYTSFDVSNTNGQDTGPLRETNYQPPVEQNEYSNYIQSDTWPLSEPIVPSLQPIQTNERDITSSLNSISPSTADENVFITSAGTLDPYAMAVDVSPTLESVPTSVLNPFASMNTVNPTQETWYGPSLRTPEPVLRQTPQQFFDEPSPFGFSQAPITQTTSLDDYLMPTQPQRFDNTYHTASPFTSQANSMTITQSMPIVPAQSIEKNNSSTPPKLTASLTTNNTAASPTDKKAKDKKKYFTLTRAKSKPEEKIRRTSAEATEEASPQSTKKERDSDSFSSEPDTSNHNSSSNKQAGGGDAKAPPKARFFDKHGVDNYLLNGCKAKADEDVKIEYDEKECGVHWPSNPNLPPFTCKIEEPSKGTKLAGLKAYMEYKIHAQTPADRVVNRRYKHFDWLHEQLVNKYRFICVPPLPGKQIAGRFETEFIEGRRRQLEIWLNRICHHPVLCASFIVQHFVTCELTEKNNKDWKTGKRRAEKDELRQASWLHCVTLTNTNLNETQIAQQIETFAQQQPGLETHLKNLSQGLSKYLERHTEIYERDIQRVGELFSKVHTAIQVDTTTPGNTQLSNSISKISTSYNAIAELYKSKASDGLRDLNERLQEYIGLLACFPTVLSIQRSASEFMRSVQQRGPAITPDFNGAIHRGHVLNHVVLAEINFFQREKVNDFNLYMKTFMDEQTQFYETVTTELRDASSTFN